MATRPRRGPSIECLGEFGTSKSCIKTARLLVLHKPSGLLTVPGRGEHLHDCLASRAASRFPAARWCTVSIKIPPVSW